MPTITDPDADERYDPQHVKAAEEAAAGQSQDQDSSTSPTDSDSTSPIVGNDLRGRNDKTAKSAADLKSSEADAVNFTGGGKAKKRWFKAPDWLTKKRVAAAGSITGLVGTGGMFFFTTIGTPAFGIMTAGSGLEHAFSKNESDSSNRFNHLFGKAYRFSKTGDIGETRVGFLGSKVFGNTIKQLEANGIKFERDPLTGRQTLTSYDRKAMIESGNFKDSKLGDPRISNAEFAQEVAKLNGLPADSVTIKNGVATADLKGQPIKALRFSAQANLRLLNGRTISAIKMRPLAKFFDIPSMFHPASKARSAAEQKIYNDIREKKIKNGETPERAAAEAKQEAAIQENTSNVKETVTGPSSEKAKAATTEVKEKVNGVAGKVTGTLTFTGFACIAYDAAKGITEANRALVYAPSVASAMRLVSLKSQIQSNQDIDMSQVGAAYKGMFDKDGNSIMQGKAFQSLANPAEDPHGPDLPADYHQAFSETSTVASIQKDAEDYVGVNIDAACSTPSLLLQAAVLIGISAAGEVASGGLGTPAVAAIWAGKIAATGLVSIVAIGGLMHIINDIAVDDQLPQKVLQGPVGGDLMAFGARAAGNVASIASGGVSLDNTTGTIAAYDPASIDADTQPRSMFARLFSVENDKSLITKVGTAYYGSELSNGLTGVASTFMNIGNTLPKMFSSMLPHASAAATNDYAWGFPQYGLPNKLLNDPSLDDPYDNADKVAALLDSSDSIKYVDRASTCFGVNIAKDSDGKWDVKLGDEAVDTASTEYTSGDCGVDDSYDGMSQDSWHRLIMFVFDTNTMKAAACYADDTQSCADLNAGGSATSDTSDDGATNNFSGDSVTLAKQILAKSDQIILTGSAKKDMQDTADGKKVTPGPIQGQSNGSASTSACSARTPVVLDPTLLQAVLTISIKYKFEIGDFVSGHDCDSGRHPMGRAMDIFKVNGKAIEGHCTDTDIYTFLKDTTDVMSKLIPDGKYPHAAGIGSCNPSEDGRKPSWVPGNINYFYDATDEIHVDTGTPS